jgi:NitT/TauT family transport system substrate-binding protein
VKTITLNVGGTFTPNGGAYDIAQYEGFFAQNGLKINAQSYNGGPPAVQALLAGRAQIANFAPSTSVETFQTKDPLIGVAYQTSGGAQYPIVSKKFLQSKGIDPDTYGSLPLAQRIADLKSTTWGTHATGGLWDHYVDIIVNAGGLTHKDVTLSALGNNNADQASFKGGRVNAIIVDKVTDQQFLQQYNAVNVFDPTDPAIQKQFAAVELSGTGFIARKSWLDSNKDTVDRFLTSLLQAAQWIKSHTDQEQADVVAKNNPDTPEATVLGYIQETDAFTLSDLQLPQASIDGNIELAIDSGAIKATPRPAGTFIFDPQYLNAVKTTS